MDQNKEFEAIKRRHETCQGVLAEDFGEHCHTDRATLITLVEAERARADKAEAQIDPASKQWNADVVGINPTDTGPVFFEKMATYARSRIAQGEQWMTISMLQYAELLERASRADKAEAELAEAKQAALAAFREWLAENGMVVVPRELLRQIYGMANEGCNVPNAAYRWCERIDEIMHAGGPLSEYEPYAQDLPPALVVNMAHLL
jgi:hypothetical protein